METTLPTPPSGPSRLRVHNEWTETTVWLLERTARFPQRLRHSLTVRMENVAIEALEELTAAAWTSRPQAPLSRAGDALNRLRALARLAHGLRALSDGQLAELARRLDAVGAGIGAWRASCGR